MFDKRPEIVAMCNGTADVIDAVNFARVNGLRVAIRGGAHGVAGNGSIDGGMMINLSRMDSARVDRAAGTIRVGGGATWGAADREAQAFGLVTPGGIVADTGVAGLTLGGGIGWVRNKYDLSCDNLLSADVVTADGELVTASATENADLLWGLQGGGGNFGVVTSFEFQLHPLGPEVMAAIPMYALEDGASVLRQWRDYVATAAEEVTSSAVIWTIPGDPAGMPPPAVGRQVLMTAALYAGPVAEGEAVLQPLREFATPIVDISSLMPFRQLQSAFDPFFANKGSLRSYWKSLYLEEISDAAIDAIIARALDRRSPYTLINIPHFGGAATRVAADGTAFGRRWPFMLSMDANTDDPDVSDSTLKTWARDFWTEIREFSAEGVYLNFLGEEEGEGAEELVRLAYGANYDRLRALKQKYDPDNFFSVNQNIAP
jgi:FAD/FMN-containing dehydrogenase